MENEKGLCYLLVENTTSHQTHLEVAKTSYKGFEGALSQHLDSGDKIVDCAYVQLSSHSTETKRSQTSETSKKNLSETIMQSLREKPSF